MITATLQWHLQALAETEGCLFLNTKTCFATVEEMQWLKSQTQMQILTSCITIKLYRSKNWIFFDWCNPTGGYSNQSHSLSEENVVTTMESKMCRLKMKLESSKGKWFIWKTH